jgi:hypothetical protein
VQLERDGRLDRDLHVDAQQVEVDRVTLDRVALDVLDEHRRAAATVDGDLEDGARMRQRVAQDAAVDREQLGAAVAAVDDPRDLARAAQAAGRARPFRGAGLECEFRCVA